MSATAYKLRKCLMTDDVHSDRISQLPDDILVSILTLLTLKESARTSVLSARWQNVWRDITHLVFYAPEVPGKMDKATGPDAEREALMMEREKYLKWVTRVLQLHQGSQLEEFRLCFDLTSASQTQIDHWLHSVFTRRVQKIELDFRDWYGILHPDTECYTFPAELLYVSGKKLWEDHARCYARFPNTFMDFKCLKELSLIDVNVSWEILRFFLHACPILETLIVHGSRDLKYFRVQDTSLSLRHLEVCCCHNLDMIIVRDVSLVSIKVTATHNLYIYNVPKLVEVFVRDTSPSIIPDTLAVFSRCLSQLVVLTLEAMSTTEIIPSMKELPKLTGLKQLIVVMMTPTDESLIRLTSLMRASPNLEKFVLKFHYKTAKWEKRKMERGVSCSHAHLKEAEFLGYSGRTCERELVNYLLDNAVALEKITVDPHQQQIYRIPENDYCSREEAFKVAEEQLKGIIPPHIELVIRP